MKPVTPIRINKFELKLADVDDPVAQRVSWEPAKWNGPNFRTHGLKVSATTIAVVRSRGLVLFAMVFALAGLALLSFGVYTLREDSVGGIIMMVMGALFAGVAPASLNGKRMLTFDKARGIYFRGRKYVPRIPPDRQEQGPLSDIYALQLMRESIVPTKGGAYTSYELNLVFADGERLNVMDHADGAAMEQSAKELAGFLDVPLWQAVY